MKKAFVSLLLSAALCSTNIPASAFSLNETEISVWENPK